MLGKLRENLLLLALGLLALLLLLVAALLLAPHGHEVLGLVLRVHILNVRVPPHLQRSPAPMTTEESVKRPLFSSSSSFVDLV